MKRNLLRLGAVVLIGLASVFVGVGIFDPAESLALTRSLDYWLFWVLFFAVGFSGITLFRSLRGSRRPFPNGALVGIGILVSWLLFEVHETNEYKILLDEPVQVAASLMMHAEREAAVPTQVHHMNGEQVILRSFVDKRPQLFPFFVSILHDLSGYRLENAFIVNSLLGLLFLVLLAAAAYRLGGYGACALALLLWAGNPEFGRAMNGAGFEILNLVLILGVLLAAWLHLELRSPNTQNLLSLVTVALAYGRYESVLFVLFAGAAITLVWWKQRVVTLSAGLLGAPVLLIPYLWRNAAFRESELQWQLFDRPESTQPFSLVYIPDNLGHALNYFLHSGNAYANSVFLAVIGGLGLALCIIVGVRLLRRELAATPVDVGFVLFLGVLALHFLVMMAYFFGQFDDFIVSRLSLPYALALVLAPVYALYRLTLPPFVFRGALVAAGIAFVAYELPKMAQHGYSQRYVPAQELHFAQEFLREHVGDQQPLLIAQMPTFWVTLGSDTTSIISANERLPQLAYLLGDKAGRPVFLYEMFDYAPERGLWVPFDRANRPPEYLILDRRVEREVVIERRLADYRILRISRLKSVEGVEPPVFEGSTLPEYVRFRAANLP